MLIIRSLLFNIFFILISIIEMLFFAPIYFFLPNKYVWLIPKFWAHTVIFLLRYIASIKIEVQGIDNIKNIKNYIIAPKHQSALETFVLLAYLDNPSYVLKKELSFIPLFGWYMAKTGIIAINRGSPLQALKQLIAEAKKHNARGRQILIFPEGTRRKPGDKPAYKAGVATLYKELKVPVVPIAHNAGLYWPKNSFYRYKGTLTIKILPPIDISLDKKQFLAKLINDIEQNCNELLMALTNEKKPPPLLEQAVKRLTNNNYA